MKITKSWLFIILFALSIGILHGFFKHSHQDSHDSTVEHYVKHSDATEYKVLCDSCQSCSCHVKSMLDKPILKLSYICIPKPQFELQNSLPSSNSVELLKPPIA